MRVAAYLVALATLLTPSAMLGAGVSDSLTFGSPSLEKMHGVKGSGAASVLKTKIGTVDERVPCRVSGPKPGDSFELTLKSSGPNSTVQIQEVYPPDSPGVRYTYDVFANGKLVYVRDYPALMFGRVSYFINISEAGKQIRLRFVNHRAGSPFRLSAVWLYSDFPAYVRRAGLDVPFYLMPLLHESPDEAKAEEEFVFLKTNLKPRADSGIKLGCSQEHHYMNRDAAASDAQFSRLLRLAAKYDMPLGLIFVSWWSGTPMNFPDGKGGRFSDPEYQQVCWSEQDDYDEGDSLKQLLGDKWDIRYGWTVPNMWSSTPWLTMNHPVLNAARHKVIGEKLALLKDVIQRPPSQDYEKTLLGIVMENEPRYWDNDCPDQVKYPVDRVKGLQADFNPVTVADAAKDGVALDPSNGLDYKERFWLHNNVAHYQQATYEAHEKALKGLRLPFAGSSGDSLWHNVYSHAFTEPVFPMEQVTNYHPGLEWNRLQRCRAGLEDVAEPATAYLDVTREWGRWAQINFEENNGIGTEQHLRHLRACHAYGARFYNFYNWQSINNEGRWTEYVQQFCADEPRALVAQTAAQPSATFVASASHQFVIEFPEQKWATINEVSVVVNKPGDYRLTALDGPEKSRVLGFATAKAGKSGLLRFELPNSVPIDMKHQMTVRVSAVSKSSFGLKTNPGNKPVASVYMNSARERAQSLVICWRADAEALIAELKKGSVRGLGNAERLFKSGDYREAYEEAARLEAGG